MSRKKIELITRVQILDDTKRVLLWTNKVKLATIVKGDQKAPFSIATTPRCKEGCYSFLLIAPLCPIHTLYCWVLSKKVSSTIFKVFGMMRPGIEHRSPGPLANTLPTGPIWKKKWIDMFLSNNISIAE